MQFAAIFFLLFLPAALVASPDLGEVKLTPSGLLDGNWLPDGTYLLKTNDPKSIKIFYRDVGAGKLKLQSRKFFEEMRDHCLALGKDWRPLGVVDLVSYKGDETFPLDLCYYSGPNPVSIARIKCSYLGLYLLENRATRREIVCRRKRVAVQ